MDLWGISMKIKGNKMIPLIRRVYFLIDAFQWVSKFMKLHKAGAIVSRTLSYSGNDTSGYNKDIIWRSIDNVSVSISCF